MLVNLLNRFFTKSLAKQLRKPSGWMAKKVANKMNVANNFLYVFTLKTMKLTDGESLLEIGFGNGKTFDHVFSQAENLRITGLDYSVKMVAEAKSNNHTRVTSNTLSLHQGTSDKMPFDDNIFDKVYCLNVVYFWEKPEDHLKEVLRVLKPGGKFYASIRTEESMRKMPFVQYGFKTYSSAAWQVVLKENGYLNIVAESVEEPRVDLDGKSFTVESLCIVGQKEG